MTCLAINCPYYNLSNKHIFLYGYGDNSNQIINNLHNSNISVEAIVDKEYNTFASEQCNNVISLGMLNNQSGANKDDTVIIIGMNSSLTQENVAEELCRYGYNNIIYAPVYSKNKNQWLISSMRKDYLTLHYGNNLDNQLFPKYKSLFSLNQEIVLSYTNYKNNVIALVRKDYIRSFLRNTHDIAISKCENIPLEKFSYLNELFEYFYHDGKFPNNYLKYYMNNTKSKEFLRDRRVLYDIFKEQYETRGMAFFIEAPTIGRLNEQSYFNLIDGYHRASFLVCIGAKYVPVIISRDDMFDFYRKRGK